MFHSDRGISTLLLLSGSFWIPMDIVQSFSKKSFPFDNVSCECLFKCLKKEETNQWIYIIYRSFTSLLLYILRSSTIPGTLMACLTCLQFRLNFYTRRRPKLRLPYFSCSCLLFGLWSKRFRGISVPFQLTIYFFASGSQCKYYVILSPVFWICCALFLICACFIYIVKNLYDIFS